MYNQKNLLKHINTLNNQDKTALLGQIGKIDQKKLAEQKELLKHEFIPIAQNLEPFTDFEKCGSLQDSLKGKALIQQGKVGCLLIAGGQGTRLNFEGPKGMFLISLIQKKSLFQLFAEKVLAASKQAARDLQLAVMTSPLNDRQTREFFEKHDYFGLKKSQVDLFCQEVLPFLDKDGNPFLETASKVALGPDGNGNSLKGFVKSGIFDKWRQKGIEYLTYVLIDNPLAEPFDAELAGNCARQKRDIVIKCIEREDPKEKVGVLVKKQGKPHIVEYTELSPKEQTATLDNHLKHLCANISLFCFSMDFVKKAAAIELPLHKSFKAVHFLDPDGQTKWSEKPYAWKFETFIFDLLPYAENTGALIFDRKDCFAPLKNKTGENSKKTVQAALLEKDRAIIESITGKKAPKEPIELSQEFYYPTQTLLEKWKGVSPRPGYIRPLA